MPNVKDIGGGVQVLDLSNILAQGQELSKMQLLRAQIDAENALTPLKAQKETVDIRNAQLEGGLKANQLQTQPQQLQANLIKTTLENTNSIAALAEKAHTSLQNGDPYPAASYVRLMTGNNDATIIKAPTGLGQWMAIDSKTSQPIVGQDGRAITYDAFAKEKADPAIQTNIASKQAFQNMAVQRMDINRQQFLETKAVNLAKQIYNSTGRTEIGAQQQTITASDRLLALAAKDGVYIPDNVDSLSPDQQQKIKDSLNKLPKGMAAEFVQSQARLLSGGVPTDHGFSVLMPDSFRQTWSDLTTKFTNKPQDYQAGEFLYNYLSSAQRERNLARGKQIQQVMGLAGPEAVMLRSDPYGRQLFDATMNQFLSSPVRGEDSKTWLTPESARQAYDPKSDSQFGHPINPTTAPSSPQPGQNKQALPGITPEGAQYLNNSDPQQNYDQMLNQGLFDDK